MRETASSFTDPISIRWRSPVPSAESPCTEFRRSSTAGSIPVPCPLHSTTIPSRTRSFSRRSSRHSSSPRQWIRPEAGSTPCWRSLPCCLTGLPMRTLSFWATSRTRTDRRCPSQRAMRWIPWRPWISTVQTPSAGISIPTPPPGCPTVSTERQ